MVAVRTISWEEASAPDFAQPTRQAWREAVANIAAKAHEKLPESRSRIEKAVALALAGDVQLMPDGTAKVASQSNGTTQYHVINGHCDCRDFERAPGRLCKHRLAFGLARRAQELLRAKRADPNDQPTASLPEAPASVNVHLTVGGHQVQLTLRDSDEDRLLIRLGVILERFSVAVQATDSTPQCPQHGTMKPSTKGKGWYCPHKLVDGSWCKGK